LENIWDSSYDGERASSQGNYDYRLLTSIHFKTFGKKWVRTDKDEGAIVIKEEPRKGMKKTVAFSRVKFFKGKKTQKVSPIS